jgi:hypothetical protein
MAAIHGLFQGRAFEPEDINRMTVALDSALAALAIKDRTNVVAELVAAKIVEIAQAGERDPVRLCERALLGLGARDRREG